MSEPESRWVAVPVALPAPGVLSAFQVEDAELLLCNVDGRAYVVEDRCPHARMELRDGALRGALLECPLHGGKIDVRDGSPAAPPIRRPARTFPVREAGAGLEVGLPAR